MNTQHIVEITLKIATQALISAHPELHHYTDYASLEGVIQSNTLWATHFSDLNDASEVKLLREPLIDALAGRFKETLRIRQGENDIIRKGIEESGGIVQTVNDLAVDFVNSFYATIFEGKGSLPPDGAFVTSFCSHAADQAYEKENGLLSQWRGYGKDGGYCIVFDTPALSALLGKEFDVNFWIHMNLAAVHYAIPDANVASLFPLLLDRSDELLSQIIDRAILAPEGGMTPFAEAATLFKHQGFKEEREVRIVAMPGTPEMAKQTQEEHKEFVPTPFKEIHTHGDEEKKKRYVTLFDSLNIKLPIKRVIVGPSRHQDTNYNRAQELLLGREINLTRSTTPFIG